MRYFWLILFFLCPLAQAEVISGKVVRVPDGDTITLLSEDHQMIKVRLSGIDAPEKNQAYGKKSQRSLAAMVAGAFVQVDYKTIDQYGRIVGKVSLAGVDIGLEQIRQGYAWHYTQYEGRQGLPERFEYADEQDLAMRFKRGLWADSDPVPPWRYRRQSRMQKN